MRRQNAGPKHPWHISGLRSGLSIGLLAVKFSVSGEKSIRWGAQASFKNGAKATSKMRRRARPPHMGRQSASKKDIRQRL